MIVPRSWFQIELLRRATETISTSRRLAEKQNSDNEVLVPVERKENIPVAQFPIGMQLGLSVVAGFNSANGRPDPLASQRAKHMMHAFTVVATLPTRRDADSGRRPTRFCLFLPDWRPSRPQD
jgi:hypothetical protein